MTNFIQLETISKSIKRYVFAIILSTKKKNCSSMSQSIGISKKHLYEVYKNSENNAKQIESLLIKMVKKYWKKELPSVLIIDPTHIKKWFAKDIENLAYDYDGVIGRSKQCLVPVIATWTNGKITIPLSLTFWINRTFTQDYKEKRVLAQELILKLKALIPFDYVTMDGEFASEPMLKFLNKHSINYSMRIARNRVVISEDGTKSQLQHHPKLKLKRNERSRTIKGTYKGTRCYFTVHKRYSTSRKSCNTVYIVSSLDINSKKQVEAYNIRWNIEKMFRTAKQSLGLCDCQCLNIEKQRTHIFSVFLAYSKLEEQKFFKRKKSPEQILHHLRSQKPYLLKFQSLLLEQTIMS